MLQPIRSFDPGTYVEIPTMGTTRIIRHGLGTTSISTMVGGISSGTLVSLAEASSVDPSGNVETLGEPTSLGCAYHPMNRGMRRPRNNCKGCMDHYLANTGKSSAVVFHNGCPKHPLYRGLRVSRSGCLTCFRIYSANHNTIQAPQIGDGDYQASSANKGKRQCRTCKGYGHNSRTCKG